MPLKKWNVDIIAREIAKEGYILLAKGYKGVHTPLSVLCPMGHTWKMRWIDFRHGTRCAYCQGQYRNNLENIRDILQKERYTLLSTTYKTTHSKLLALCPNGHRYEFQWCNFKQGYRCRECCYNLMTIEKIKEILASEGYVLLSKDYVSVNKHIQVQCPHQHLYWTTWNNFQQGYRCPTCAKQKTCSKGEQKLGKLLAQIFLGHEIRRQDNLGFLGNQAVDYSVPDCNCAFEYDGQQHFEPVRWGGMSYEEAQHCLEQNQKRDIRKDILCKKYGVCLVRVSYQEPLTLEFLKAKLEVI